MVRHVERISAKVKLNLKFQCDYSNAQILTSGTITITEAAADKEKEYQLKVVRHLLIA